MDPKNIFESSSNINLSIEGAKKIGANTKFIKARNFEKANGRASAIVVFLKSIMK